MVNKKKRILVLTDQMPWGHRSIAKAIFSFLKTKEKEENFEVFYADAKAELGPSNDVYSFLCRYFPLAFRTAYKLGTSNASSRVMAEISLKSLPGLKKVVNKVHPDLIISAYFLHTHCLASWREKENLKFKLWTVVADPWSILPVAIVKKADLNLIYDDFGLKMADKYGVPREKMLITGWWVRPEMYQTVDRKKARAKLGFTDDRPVIFIGGGSLGTNSLSSILPVLMVVRKKVGVILNTGIDKMAYNLVEEYSKLFKRLRKDDMVQIKNMGWIENMAEVLAAADIVFGKAGPNFMFDSIAREKPFVAITHIGGQEDGNIALLKKKKLGWVKEKGNSAAEFFIEYVENPGKFQNKYKENVMAEAKKNKGTMEVILKRIRKDLI